MSNKVFLVILVVIMLAILAVGGYSLKANGLKIMLVGGLKRMVSI